MRRTKRRRGAEISDRGAKDLRGRLGLHEQAATSSTADHLRRRPPRGSVGQDELAQNLPGENLRAKSVPDAALAASYARSGHGHNWGDLPGGMGWGQVDQGSFFRTLDRRYRRLR